MKDLNIDSVKVDLPWYVGFGLYLISMELAIIIGLLV